MKIEELLSPAETMVGQKPSDKARLIQDIALGQRRALGWTPRRSRRSCNGARSSVRPAWEMGSPYPTHGCRR